MDKPPQQTPLNAKSIADFEGPWADPGFESGLIDRARKNWATPIAELSNGVLAMFLRQPIATAHVATEARRRINAGISDDTELYDDELKSAVAEFEDRGQRE